MWKWYFISEKVLQRYIAVDEIPPEPQNRDHFIKVMFLCVRLLALALMMQAIARMMAEMECGLKLKRQLYGEQAKIETEVIQ